MGASPSWRGSRWLWRVLVCHAPVAPPGSPGDDMVQAHRYLSCPGPGRSHLSGKFWFPLGEVCVARCQPRSGGQSLPLRCARPRPSRRVWLGLCRCFRIQLVLVCFRLSQKFTSSLACRTFPLSSSALVRSSPSSCSLFGGEFSQCCRPNVFLCVLALESTGCGAA